MVSKQWFVKMKPLAEPAIECVKDGSVRLIPERMEKIYYNWMENIKDWCISRQLWWGHQIPAWYCADCGEIMQVGGSTAYALLTNIGGEFKPGDRILFDMSHHDQNVDLFEIPVPAQLEQELVIELDESAYESKYCC